MATATQELRHRSTGAAGASAASAYDKLSSSMNSSSSSGSSSSERGSKIWQWGRSMKGSLTDSIGAIAMLTLTPLVPLILLHSCEYHQCSVIGSFQQAIFEGVSLAWIPPVTLRAVLVYVCWFMLQFVLYVFLPGPLDVGQPTPAGHLLTYKVNGLRAWIVSHVLLFFAVYVFDLFPATIIADEWMSLCTVLNLFGYFWTFFAYFKAHFFPSHPDDCKFSGSMLYDIFMGVEHNPRFGDWFDFKLFFNGRPGIVGWSVINFSFAAKQYAEFGYVTNSMVALIVLHLTYILDFFYHEGWYLRTIDIAHDHFGFYLAWGDTVWLPLLYPLQSLYLSKNPVNLSTPALIGVYALGAAGYYVFRAVNNQKDLVRSTNGNCKIWGKPAEFIKVKYQTMSGVKESLLLTSGFWGLSRHFNYVGDLLLSLAMCLTCGVSHILPFFYIIFMTIVLLHRVGRDHDRCSAKYGQYWVEYCKKVPYKVLPYVH